MNTKMRRVTEKAYQCQNIPKMWYGDTEFLEVTRWMKVYIVESEMGTEVKNLKIFLKNNSG